MGRHRRSSSGGKIQPILRAARFRRGKPDDFRAGPVGPCRVMNVPFSFSPARRLLASFVLLLIACDEPVEIPDAGSDGPDAGALMDASSGEDASTDGGDASSGALDGGESDAGTGASTPDGGSDGGAPDAGEPPDPPGTWRSVLFPRGWLPLHAGGGADAEGRFLPDFAYA